jgi:hypothetical protein
LYVGYTKLTQKQNLNLNRIIRKFLLSPNLYSRGFFFIYINGYCYDHLSYYVRSDIIYSIGRSVDANNNNNRMRQRSYCQRRPHSVTYLLHFPNTTYLHTYSVILLFVLYTYIGTFELEMQRS